jgi:cytochrome P450
MDIPSPEALMTKPLTIDDIRVQATVPDHVPADRVVDLSFATGLVPNDLLDPYAPFDWLNGPEIPRILFSAPSAFASPLGGGSGSWWVTHYEDIERVYTDNETFTNVGAAAFQRLIGETFRSIPLGVDPPDHGKYRHFLMPHFSPAGLKKMEVLIRAVVVEMIDEIAAKGEADIAWDFTRVFPVRIFMALMGFPPPMFDQFLDWEWDILHSNDLAKMQAALKGVVDFLRSFMAEKEATPDDCLVSKIVNGTIEGRPLNEEEKIGIVWFLWLGGLDTVAATLAQMFRRMGLQPDIQDRLRDHPEWIQTASEEFLRTQPILATGRIAKFDFEWHGVTIKQGETIMCLNASGNFDPAQYPDPRTFDPARRINRHFTFVGGSHRCLGAPLARREMWILLEEWFKRIPEFRIKPGTDSTVFPGLLSIRNLYLVWDGEKAKAMSEALG